MEDLGKIRKLKQDIINDNLPNNNAIELLLEYIKDFDIDIDLEYLTYIEEISKIEKLKLKVKVVEKRILKNEAENLKLMKLLSLKENELSSKDIQSINLIISGGGF